MRGPLREWADALITEHALEADGVFCPSMVLGLWTRFLRGEDRHQYLLWNILIFQDWYRYWGKRTTPVQHLPHGTARTQAHKPHQCYDVG